MSLGTGKEGGKELTRTNQDRDDDGGGDDDNKGFCGYHTFVTGTETREESGKYVTEEGERTNQGRHDDNDNDDDDDDGDEGLPDDGFRGYHTFVVGTKKKWGSGEGVTEEGERTNRDINDDNDDGYECFPHGDVHTYQAVVMETENTADMKNVGDNERKTRERLCTSGGNTQSKSSADTEYQEISTNDGFTVGSKKVGHDNIIYRNWNQIGYVTRSIKICKSVELF